MSLDNTIKRIYLDIVEPPEGRVFICQKESFCGIVTSVKKILFFVAPFLLAIIVFSGFVFYLSQNSQKGALQITAVPKSKIYLDNKLIGETPLCKCDGSDMLTTGQYTLKLVPMSNETTQGDFSPYEEKITIGSSVLTVIDKMFGKGAFGEEKTITLSKLADGKAVELVVISFPQDVQVFLDNTELGKTPLSSKILTASDHELRLVKEGYKEKTIRIRTVSGYKLTVVATLGVLPDLGVTQASGSAQEVASPSALPSVVKVTILNTPTGFLRVRESNSLESAEIARVNPGDTFDFIEEKDGWFEIKLKDEKVGWVSNQYAKKQ